MKVYRNKENGYLMIEDISDGIDILSSAEYEDMLDYIEKLEKANRDLDVTCRMLKEERDDERERNNKMMFDIGQLYARLETVKRAHYLDGYAAGAWQIRHKSLKENNNLLREEVSKFPELLENALSELKNLINKN